MSIVEVDPREVWTSVREEPTRWIPQGC